ncbi:MULTISPECIES: LLM class flavin-dependent oxidoreductase [Sinorhizobium/Ensifer group]|uniref:LLM class flavin-dependent oxidoreductase n=1 Tax=Sinorhizobium/Ensifer group TaxID=227292 RepID=UPI000710B978|nr:MULTISPECIES: LLM class flavin-dependent oxidoreductase [Sinorhizobium/Ensifer group]KRD51377.1 alkane 1-monooxygenase [Ensifer sp. Root278]KSV82765.1 alkane 1-monooxygenase [Sinorhizobium sp. Sb3]KSV94549.1 alkane 1-monooxygenase [Sinorhizobium sp. GL28]MBD9509682.1 LLM class flavin-dependent oxidoreductase [Ensifer sp. ENS10]MBV7519224.1 LLM class flavin-dependent oxidoreductase [Ensifer sp. ENS12]
MATFSVLDLSPITQGGSIAQSLENSRRLAQAAEENGYQRFWLAEHHGMKGIASAATSLVISHVAAATKTIRVGSGGIMLPNHSPLVIAEQFGTLAALYPGRIDLGLGRAPGTDMRTAQALRRNMEASGNNFPNDVVELQALLGPVAEDQKIIAVPGADTNVPIWLLGSSHFSAHLAGMLGLPFAFASHFAPDMLLSALEIYRERFTPSETLDKPHVMVGVMGVAADTDEEANYLFTSMQQSFVALRRNARGQFPPPVQSMDGLWSYDEKIFVDHSMMYAVVGGPETIRRKIGTFLDQTKADELIISMPIFDMEARLHSLRLFADAQKELVKAA